MDNVFNAITAVQDLSSGDDPDAAQTGVQDILGGLMPASVTELETPEAQEEAFAEIVTGLLAAADIYQELGDNLISDPEAGNEDITGGTLTNAAVAGIVDIVVTDLIDPTFLPAPDDPEYSNAAAGVLWAVYQESLAPEPDLSQIEGFDTTAELSLDITEVTYLQNIAVTANMDLGSLFGSETPAI